ncbi:hypothetical protein IWX49DRAFT_558621 [Phyllosticta citricarpa]|uniref:Uncharacterized protein n=2 Tax=Phyllosticta TaxID=121621 RepID=A0ABR1MRM9_9PEZI
MEGWMGGMRPFWRAAPGVAFFLFGQFGWHWFFFRLLPDGASAASPSPYARQQRLGSSMHAGSDGLLQDPERRRGVHVGCKTLLLLG